MYVYTHDICTDGVNKDMRILSRDKFLVKKCTWSLQNIMLLNTAKMFESYVTIYQA